MIGKILIASGTLLIGFHFKKVLSLNDSERRQVKLMEAMEIALSLTGKVVKAENSDTLYLLRKISVKYPTRIEYVSYQAYLNDGKKEIVVLPEEIINAMSRTSNAFMTENGFAYDKE